MTGDGVLLETWIALVNDTDAEVDPRTASLVSGPVHGSPDPGRTGTVTVTMLVIV